MTNEFSYLRHVNEDIEYLKTAAKECRGTAVATNAAKATRDLEGALANKEIDGHRLVTTLGDIGKLIKSFDENCDCNKKAKSPYISHTITTTEKKWEALHEEAKRRNVSEDALLGEYIYRNLGV